MENLISKLLVMLTLTCALLSGYCAGDEQAEGSNKGENAAIKEEQASWRPFSPEILAMIENHIRNVNIGSNRLRDISELAARLSTAARDGQADVVTELLLEAPADIRGGYMGQALLSAVSNRDVEMVEQLVSGREHISAEDIGVAVIMAAMIEDAQIIKLLLDCRKDIRAESISEALAIAACNGYKQIVEHLLACCEGISAEDIGKAMIAAARSQDIEMVTLLLTGREDIRPEDIGQAIVAAARNQDVEMVTLLLAGREDISAEDIGWALFAAAREGDVEVARLLLEAGAKLTITDCIGHTALDLARQNNHLEVVELLEQAEHDARQAAFEPEAAVLQPGEFEGANVRNATIHNAVPTPMPRPTIGCDLHARGAMLGSVCESYL